MLELIIPFEFVKQALIRKLSGYSFGKEMSYFGVALFIFMLEIFPLLITGGEIPAQTSDLITAVGALGLVGFIMLSTIILAPIGFILF